MKKELEVIKPKLVVTFGTDARDYLKAINNSIQNKFDKFGVVSLPHPSQINWVYWKLFIFSQAWCNAPGNMTKLNIDWCFYARLFTVKNNEYGNPPKRPNKMDDIINKIALDIISSKLKSV